MLTFATHNSAADASRALGAAHPAHRRVPRRHVWKGPGSLFALPLLLLCGLPAARALEPTVPEDSLARTVPAGVGLFVELRNGAELLTPLVDPQVWVTLAELAGQPAALPDTEQWRHRVEQTVRMTPAEAIQALFSRRVAFVSEDVRNTQDAVILCRPETPPRDLIRRWQARPLPTSGRTALYRLPFGVGLALHEDVLFFGDHAGLGMFDQVVLQSEGQGAASLAEDPAYQKLLARVPPNPDGVFFARLTPLATSAAPTTSSAPTTRAVQTRPAQTALPDLPRLLRNSNCILLALHKTDGVLHISAVGDAPGVGVVPVRDGHLGDLVTALPHDTLLAWAGHLDYPQLVAAAATLPERSIFRIAYDIQQRSGTVQRLAAALDSPTCIAIGSVLPASRVAPAPPIPAAALLIQTRAGPAAATEWGNIFHSTLALYKLLSLKLAAPPRISPIEVIDVGGGEGELLDLSGVLGQAPEKTPVGELHVCWTLDGDVLILATHAEWLRRVVAARHGVGARLAEAVASSRHPRAAAQETVFVAQSGALADLGGMWLGYFNACLPQVLSPEWWRDYQPGGPEVRIGIQVTEDAEQRRLVVQTVLPHSAADGILRPADAIVGCNRRRFATSQPVDEMGRGLAERPNPRWIELLIEREGLVRLRRVPLPFVDPVEVLRRLNAVGRVFQRVTYLDTVPDQAGSRGYLTLEMRSGTDPLYQLPPVITEPSSPPPVAPGLETQPAVTQPASVPLAALHAPADSAPAPPASQPAGPAAQPPPSGAPDTAASQPAGAPPPEMPAGVSPHNPPVPAAPPTPTASTPATAPAGADGPAVPPAP